MKKLFLTSVAMGALVAAGGVAHAADPMPIVVAPTVVAPAPVPAPVRIWTGGYIGGHAGLARGRLADGLTCDDDDLGPVTAYFFVEEPGDDFDADGDCDWNLFAGTLDPDQNAFDVKYFLQEGENANTRGYLAGAQIGFNFQFGNGPNGFVVGAEVAHSFANIQADFQSYAEFEGLTEWNSRFEISRLTTATVRAGFAFGRALAYGEVGLAIGQASWTNTLGFTDTEMAHGLVYGGGLEVAIGNNVSVFGEYNRVRLNHSFLGTTFLVLPTQVGVQSTTNIFKVGFNIHL
ncbi:MAG: outer membrane beta-barrel protein [Bauldia sp.]|nr:outer membrane beta-barrel protein [Bauldia sp.]